MYDLSFTEFWMENEGGSSVSSHGRIEIVGSETTILDQLRLVSFRYSLKVHDTTEIAKMCIRLFFGTIVVVLAPRERGAVWQSTLSSCLLV